MALKKQARNNVVIRGVVRRGVRLQYLNVQEYFPINFLIEKKFRPDKNNMNFWEYNKCIL